MKTVVFLLAALLPISGHAIDACMSGSYYAEATNGTGIDVQIGDETAVLFRYGYLAGDSEYWVGAAANDDDSVLEFDAFQTYGPGGGEQMNVGTMSIDVIDGETLLFSWAFHFDARKSTALPWCLSADCGGTEELKAIFQPRPCDGA